MQKLKSKQKNALERFIQETTKADEVLRAQVVLMLDEQDSFVKIHRLTEFSKTHAHKLRRNYLACGIDALKDKRKGAPKELLTKQQRDEIIETVKTKKPTDVGCIGDYWTTGILGTWIKECYEVSYKSKTSLHLVFRKAVFTYHKPDRIYDKHNPKEVKKWEKETKPMLARYWQEPDAVILSEDEMILTTATTTQSLFKIFSIKSQ